MKKEKSHFICEQGNERMLVSSSSSQDGLKSITRLARFLRPCATSLSTVESIPNTPLLHEIFTHTDKKWPSGVHFKTWHMPQKDWGPWLDRLAGKYGAIWNQADVCDAIISSKYENRCNKDILLGLAEYWCPETNTFVFPWGEVTITLEDVMILGGFPVLGQPATRPIVQGKLAEIEEEMEKMRREVSRCKSRKASHSVWLKHFMEKGDEFEHVGFLSLWLSRYVFPSLPEKVINKHVFPVAVHLSQGTRMALGPAVLASIYRNLTLLRKQAIVSEGDIIASGPLHLVQIWAFERFPLLVGPKNSPNLLNPGEPRAARWNRITSRIDLPYVRSFIKLAENFVWRPYADMRHLSYYNQTRWLVVDGRNLDDDQLRSYGKFLCASALTSFDFEEKYSPHRVAMQFGLDQDLPGNSSGINFDLENSKILVPPRSVQPSISARYHRWWTKCKLDRRENSVTSAKRGNLSSLHGFSSKTKMHCSYKEENQVSIATWISKKPRTMTGASSGMYTGRKHSSIHQELSSKTKMQGNKFEASSGLGNVDNDAGRRSMESKKISLPMRVKDVRADGHSVVETVSSKCSKKSPHISTNWRSPRIHAFISHEFPSAVMSGTHQDFDYLDHISLAERLKHFVGTAANRKRSSQEGAFPSSRSKNHVSSRVFDGVLRKRKSADTAEGIYPSKRTTNSSCTSLATMMGLNKRLQKLEKVVAVTSE